MRPIHWLHISDIHLREGNEWSQDVVLNSMCVCISELRKAGKEPDFVLVTGDIAFSREGGRIRAGSRFLR